MLLIYGLGNNQTKYLQTKHNVGRLVLESLAKELKLSFRKKLSYTISQSLNDSPQPLNNQNSLLLQVDKELLECQLFYSNGYMNQSGLPLRDFLKNLSTDKLTTLRLLILHDDSDQLVGSYKLTVAGGSAGHHGVQNIYEHILPFALRKEQIWRLKIGIRPVGNRQRSETFVLASLSSFELEQAHKLAEKIREHLNLFRAPDNKAINYLQTIFNTNPSKTS